MFHASNELNDQIFLKQASRIDPVNFLGNPAAREPYFYSSFPVMC